MHTTLFPIRTGLHAPPHPHPALARFWNFAHTPIWPRVDQEGFSKALGTHDFLIPSWAGCSPAPDCCPLWREADISLYLEPSRSPGKGGKTMSMWARVSLPLTTHWAERVCHMPTPELGGAGMSSSLREGAVAPRHPRSPSLPWQGNSVPFSRLT